MFERIEDYRVSRNKKIIQLEMPNILLFLTYVLFNFLVYAFATVLLIIIFLILGFWLVKLPVEFGNHIKNVMIQKEYINQIIQDLIPLSCCAVWLCINGAIFYSYQSFLNLKRRNRR